MVNRYGRDEVLEVLPLCMKDLAREWYDTLQGDLLERMDRSVDNWIIQLRARFARSPIDAEDDADRCKFSFAQENRVDLRTYLTRQQNLLVEAGVEGPRQNHATCLARSGSNFTDHRASRSLHATGNIHSATLSSRVCRSPAMEIHAKYGS